MLERLGHQIADSFLRLTDAFLAVIPAFLVVLASLLLGALTGLLVRTALKLLLRWSRFEKTGSSAASNRLLRAAGVRAEPAQLVGAVSFWFAVVVALAVGVNALEPGALRDALRGAVSFLPRLLTALLLLLLGLGLAGLVRRSVLIAAVNAGLPWARPGARFLSVVVISFFAAVALDHLGVGQSILVAAFSIAGGGLVLALALAFGLGAKDLARGYLEKKLRAEEEDTGIRHV